MKILPIGDRILIKIIKLEMHKGIILPDRTMLQGTAATAEVIGLGQGYTSDKKADDNKTIWEPLESKIGDKIIFNARAGLGLTPEYRLIHESEIIARICDDGIDIGDKILTGDGN